jgi:hypothetical protein
LIVGTVVQNEQKLTQKISYSLFIKKFQRVTDYLLQQLQKLFESF